MELGAFSVSLSVKDLEASLSFYQKLGFSQIGGNIEDKWIILKNGQHIIGLFQGMFENNMLTFNPGWNQNAENVDPYTDVRELQQQIKASGIEPVHEADENSTGPANLVIQDPDGNIILIDQHR